MSIQDGDELEEFESGPPAPEFRPLQHPQVLFRSHSSEGRYRVVYLGGEDYWMHGIWTAQDGSRVVVVKDRVFSVSELRHSLAALPIPPSATNFRPFMS